MSRYPVHVKLFKKRAAALEPEPVVETSAKSTGKGRATPKRKDAEARRLHPVVPTDRKAAKAKARAEQDESWRRQREAMRTGDERYLPARDKGPVKRYIRDYVDARLNLGEFFMPLVFVLLIFSFGLSRILPQYPVISFYAVLAMNGYLLLAIVDAVWCWNRLRRRLHKKFGEERVKNEGMIFFYIMSRCFMLRRWRRPATLVKRGQYPS